jgi:hypothetical protein
MRSRTGFMRERNLVSDERLDTLALLSEPQNRDPVWIINLPNGTYDVTIGVGDPTGHGVSSVAVNGVVAISEFHSTAAHPFATVTVQATVNEFGQLSLDPNGEGRSRWDYVDIVQVS